MATREQMAVHAGGVQQRTQSLSEQEHDGWSRTKHHRKNLTEATLPGSVDSAGKNR